METYKLGTDQIEILATDARLGEGFNSLDLTPRPQASLFPLEIINASMKEELPSQTSTELTMYIAETSYELIKKLNVNVEMAAYYTGLSSRVAASGSAKYVQNLHLDEKSFVFCIHGKTVSRRVSLTPNPKFLDCVKDSLKKPALLLRTIGDYYCSELIYGGELTIFFKVKANESTMAQGIKTSLRALAQTKLAVPGKKKSKKKGQNEEEEDPGAGGRLSSSVSSSFNEITKNADTTVELSQIGGKNVPKDRNFETCLLYAFDYFNQDLKNNLIRAVYRPITNLPLFEEAATSSLDDLTSVLKPVWERRDNLLGWIGDYQRAQDEYEQAFNYKGDKYYLPRKYIELIKKEIEENKNDIKEAFKKNAGSIELCDADNVIPAGKKPPNYKDKLEKRLIKKTPRWGGSGGKEEQDLVKDLEGITSIKITSDDRSGGVIGSISTTVLKHDGTEIKKEYGVPDPDKTGFLGIGEEHHNKKSFIIPLNKGEQIDRIEVWADNYVRQIKVWIHGQKEPKGPFPPVDQPKKKWPDAQQYGMKDIIVVGLIVRCGAWIDALGIQYVDL